MILELRLVLITETHVAVQFNGPILQFSEDNPLLHESISRLGPDALKPDFDIKEAKNRLNERIKMKLVDSTYYLELCSRSRGTIQIRDTVSTQGLAF